MKRTTTTTLLATLLTGLLVASAVQAGPFLFLEQLLGMGTPDVTAPQSMQPARIKFQKNYHRNFGGYGPQAGPLDVTTAGSGSGQQCGGQCSEGEQFQRRKHAMERQGYLYGRQ